MKKFLLFFTFSYILISFSHAQIVPDANGIVYVTTTGAAGNGTAWSTSANLDSALKAAKTNLTIKEIWIKGGTYQPQYDTNGVVSTAAKKAYYIRSNLKVYGSLAGTETSISNNGNYPIASTDTTYLDGNNTTNNIVYLKNTGATTLLNGLVIRNSKGFGGKGGGLINDGGGGGNSVVTITNCIFRDNKSAVTGGGACNWGNGGYAKITFTNCVFLNNQANAANVTAGAVANCGNNSGQAFAVFNNCSFTSNTAMGKGGAIDNNGYIGLCDASFNNCIFKYNQSTNNYGGVLLNNAQQGNAVCTFKNCSFYVNRGNLGANLVETDCSTNGVSTVNIINCSSYERTTATLIETIHHGNGGVGGTATTNIYNSIIWKGNGYTYSTASTFTKTGSPAVFTSTYNISNTIVQGIPPSGTTYNFYPNFMDTVHEDLRLQICSPAMEKGNNSLYSGNLLSDFDLAYKPRLVNANIDLGAYEVFYHAPLITKEPINATTCYRTDTSFSAIEVGDSLVYEWQAITPSSEGWGDLTSGGTFTIIKDVLKITSADTTMNGWQFRLIIKNCLGADTTNVVTLTVKKGPILVPLTNKSACTGDTLYLKVVSLSGSGVTYNWNGPQGFASNVKDTFITPVNSASAGIYVLQSGNGICTISDTMRVTIDTPLVLTITATNPVCMGQNLYLDINDTISGNTYSWIGPNGFISSLKNPAISPALVTNSGMYTVKVTGNSSCKNTFSKNVIVSPLPPPRVVQKY